MITPLQLHDGTKLLRDGWSDEDVERLTGLNLESIITLRGEAAAAVFQVPSPRLWTAQLSLADRASRSERIGISPPAR